MNPALFLSPARKVSAKVRARRIAQANRLPKSKIAESAPYVDRVFQERQETEKRSFTKAWGDRRARAILRKKQSDDRSARRRGRFLLELAIASSPRHAEELARRLAPVSVSRPVRRQARPRRAAVAPRQRCSTPPSGPDDCGDGDGGAESTPARSRCSHARGPSRRDAADQGARHG